MDLRRSRRCHKGFPSAAMVNEVLTSLWMETAWIHRLIPKDVLKVLLTVPQCRTGDGFQDSRDNPPKQSERASVPQRRA